MFKKTIYADYDIKFQKLVTFSGYLFLLQFVLFVIQVICIVENAPTLAFASQGDWSNFLLKINDHSASFFVMKALFLALRTCYSISFIGLGLAFVRKYKSVVAVLIACMIVAVPMINLGSLYQMTLIPLSNSYAQALAQQLTPSISAYEIAAKTIYTMTEYADLFVNIVPFLGVFICWFIMIFKEPFFKYTKWVILLIALLPFNRFMQIPAGLNLVAGLLNIVGTILIFIATGVYLLKLSPVKLEQDCVRDNQ